MERRNFIKATAVVGASAVFEFASPVAASFHEWTPARLPGIVIWHESGINMLTGESHDGAYQVKPAVAFLKFYGNSNFVASLLPLNEADERSLIQYCDRFPCTSSVTISAK